MRRFTILAAALVVAIPGLATAQSQPQAEPMPGSEADAANAASMPMQGTAAVLAAPAAEPQAYPPCSRTRTDQCVNPREAGRGYGNRPLEYWPGQPASERPR